MFFFFVFVCCLQCKVKLSCNLTTKNLPLYLSSSINILHFFQKKDVFLSNETKLSEKVFCFSSKFSFRRTTKIVFYLKKKKFLFIYSRRYLGRRRIKMNLITSRIQTFSLSYSRSFKGPFKQYVTLVLPSSPLTLT